MSESDASNRHRLHHLIWECNLALVPLTDEAFADTELTLALSGTLDEIAATPGATVADISRRTPKTQQAISQAVAKLETLGYVERRLGGGRGVGLYLTAAGEGACADGVEREDWMEVRLRELLGSDVYEEMVEALERGRSRLRTYDSAEPTKASQS